MGREKGETPGEEVDLEALRLGQVAGGRGACFGCVGPAYMYIGLTPAGTKGMTPCMADTQQHIGRWRRTMYGKIAPKSGFIG